MEGLAKSISLTYTFAMAQLRFGPPPTATYERQPSDEEVQFFLDNGFLAVDRLTTDEELEWMTQIFDAVFAEPSDATFQPGGAAPAGEPSLLTQSMFPEMRFPELLDTTYRRNARRYAAALLDVNEADLTSWGHMILKPPRKSRPAPWHQDEAYWDPELSYTAIAAWLPLHDVTVERGCMQFIPGSHKGDVLVHHHSDGNPSGNLLWAEGVDESTAVACELPAGGATFHHPRTLHYTAPNTTDQPRLAFPTEFQLQPVRREKPVTRPWVDEFRAATGQAGPPPVYVADGRFVPIPA
jgi:hypothetical protein